MIYSVRYFLKNVTVLCFQRVVKIDMFRTELTFKTAIKEALLSGEVRFRGTINVEKIWQNQSFE